MVLQDVAEVSYIPLETTDEFLVAGSAQVQSVYSKGIVIWHKTAEMIWETILFHRDGKGWLRLDKEGQGPGEYDRMQSVVVDWDKERIFVEPFKKMDVYSFDLKHLNQFEKKWFAERDYIYELSDEPFFFLLSLGGDVYVDDASCDTIYRLDAVTEQLMIVLVHTPTFESGEETEFVLKMKGSTSRYYLLRLEAKKLPMEGNKAINTKISILCTTVRQTRLSVLNHQQGLSFTNGK